MGDHQTFKKLLLPSSLMTAGLRFYAILRVGEQKHTMDSTGPEAYVPDAPEACTPEIIPKHHTLAFDHPKQHESESKSLESPEKERMICGMRTATFVLSVLLVLLVLIAAVGGGVGGTLAVRKAREYSPHAIRFHILDT
ncbi:hypothetical protein JMJ77_0009180 [Colletotrichum scovillei]|uniref:Uncharacterized protein n=1 Tax=Colletotrichum scovillei TaxID=1209932 RepID=A0A9P7QXR1_9PEZI|nr:hypothetical protein JMJ77_0009180 [Colletotrichum scovillei]KAG7052255.1 hypothetical protein JMJ78_0005276 [Colletotrichum scovillei]KAG7064546.1 hypothetical protein JMJ76_0012309 [Colletotrichum scovillei]